MFKKVFLVLIIFISCFNIFSEPVMSMDFKDKEIKDIIMSIATVCEKSVTVDNDIKGKTSFHFENMTFEDALSRICSQNNIFFSYDKTTQTYSISRINIVIQNDLVQINCEDADIETILRSLSRKTHTTILYDPLPKGTLSLRTGFIQLVDILNLIITKYYEYSLIENANGFYIAKTYATQTDSRGLSQIKFTKNGNLYSISFKKSTLGLVIEKMFSTTGNEYSLFFKPSNTIENVSYTDKTFDELLSLILDLANADFYIENDFYYIFEIQKKDILKNLKQTQVISVKNYSVQEILNLIPAELSSQSGIKADKTENKLYITGSKTETFGLVNFIKQLDSSDETESYYKRFNIKYLKIDQIQSIIPQNIVFSPISILPESNSFITRVTKETEKKLTDFLELVDKPKDIYILKLKYKKADELIKNLPPSFDKNNLTLTGDDSLLFYNGTQENFNHLKQIVEKIDTPAPQIKYHLLVVQYSDSTGFDWNAGINSFSNTSNKPFFDITGFAKNAININFDVISTLGFKLSALLDASISQQKANILADTTITSLSGKEVSFKNTDITRYRNIIYDSSSKVQTTTTQEVSSGLVITINGWVSSDNMITVDVKAQISKISSSNSASLQDNAPPPNTTEKTIDTHVRTRSGKSIIIGGLLQKEKDVTDKHTPGLGKIPLLGYLFKSKTTTERSTELVIYLIPFVENDVYSIKNVEENIDRYISEFL